MQFIALWEFPVSLRKGRKIYVTGGDSTVNFSGCAFYLTESLREELPDFQVEAVPTHSYRELYGATAMWGLRMRTDPQPYFFMTRQFQNANWLASRFDRDPNAILISFPQIAISPDVGGFAKTYLYVDMTHRQYLSYGQFAGMPRRIQDEIFAQERASYASADRIFAAASEVRRQLIEHYSIADDRIEVIGRGLNMPLLRRERRREVKSDDRLRVGFMGLDFERKGLRDLIAAIDADTSLQQRVALEVIGPGQGDLPDRAYMSLHGYINKDQDLDKLIAILDRCDLGFLFSRSEGVPGSVLEFLSRGVPCLISDIPPMRSLTHLPGVVSLPLAQGAAIIGDTLRGLLALPDRLRSLKAAACASKLAGWQEQAQCIGRWCRT